MTCVNIPIQNLIHLTTNKNKDNNSRVFFSQITARSHHTTNLDLLSFVNEDYIAGYTQDGQMSTVRRFFCLFVAFDLFFISMLWFICIMVSDIDIKLKSTDIFYHFISLQMKGETILNALKEQVVHYTIEKSLFDIIFAALVRFLLLIIFYGVFAINHWSIIAVSQS